MELLVTERNTFGKANKHLRAEGLVPAELYGHDVPNAHLAVKASDFAKLFNEVGENTIITLSVNGTKHPVLIHDVKRHYLTDDIEHVDFYEVRMDERVTAHIPLEFVGEAPAVKEQGGFLNKSLTEISVEALPGDLPHSFRVDLSVLDDFEKHIAVRDLSIPSGIKLLIEVDTVIASVTPPAAEKEEVLEEPADVSQVKVEGEEKKAERDAEKAVDAKKEEAAA